jgi:hypothetical protein
MGGSEVVNPELAPSPTNPVENTSPVVELTAETLSVAPTLRERAEDRAANFIGGLKTAVSDAFTSATDSLRPSRSTSRLLRTGATALALTLFASTTPAEAQTDTGGIVTSSTILENTATVPSNKYPNTLVPIDGLVIHYFGSACYGDSLVPMATFGIESTLSDEKKADFKPYIDLPYITESSKAVSPQIDIQFRATSKTSQHVYGRDERLVRNSMLPSVPIYSRSSSLTLSTNSAKVSMKVKMTYETPSGEIKVLDEKSLDVDFESKCPDTSSKLATQNEVRNGKVLTMSTGADISSPKNKIATPIAAPPVTRKQTKLPVKSNRKIIPKKTTKKTTKK